MRVFPPVRPVYPKVCFARPAPAQPLLHEAQAVPVLDALPLELAHRRRVRRHLLQPEQPDTMKPSTLPTRQRPACELEEIGITIPYWVNDMSKPVTYHMTIAVLPRPILEQLTIISRKRAAVILNNERDNRDNLDYAPTAREMHAVVRHMLINRTVKNAGQGAGYHNGFDNILHKITAAGGPDAEQRKLTFKRHVAALIAAHYPYLALESEHYIFKCEGVTQ